MAPVTTPLNTTKLIQMDDEGKKAECISAQVIASQARFAGDVFLFVTDKVYGVALKPANERLLGRNGAELYCGACLPYDQYPPSTLARSLGFPEEYFTKATSPVST